MVSAMVVYVGSPVVGATCADASVAIMGHDAAAAATGASPRPMGREKLLIDGCNGLVALSIGRCDGLVANGVEPGHFPVRGRRQNFVAVWPDLRWRLLKEGRCGDFLD